MEIGSRELFVVAVAIFFLFGLRRVPELAKDIADAVRQFRSAFKDDVVPATREKE